MSSMMQLGTNITAPTPSQVLAASADTAQIPLPGHLAGFGGAHGGLVAAFAAGRGRAVLGAAGFDAPHRDPTGHGRSPVRRWRRR